MHEILNYSENISLKDIKMNFVIKIHVKNVSKIHKTIELFCINTCSPYKYTR
jgi:hypothetical protein